MAYVTISLGAPYGIACTLALAAAAKASRKTCVTRQTLVIALARIGGISARK